MYLKDNRKPQQLRHVDQVVGTCRIPKDMQASESATNFKNVNLNDRQIHSKLGMKNDGMNLLLKQPHLQDCRQHMPYILEQIRPDRNTL